MSLWLRRCDSFAEEANADFEYWSALAPSARVSVMATLKRDWEAMNHDKTPPSKDYVELFAALNRHGVRSLVVGAYAVAFHARPRFTKDLDIFVEPTGTNAQHVLAALTDFGFGDIGLTPADFATHGRIVQLGFPPNRIDLITSIDGITFAEAWESRVRDTFGGEPVWYIGREALIRNKRASARPQDLLDLELLQHR